MALVNSGFVVGQKVVYPSHGVGVIVNIEQQNLMDQDIRFYVINFENDKMKIKVPFTRADQDGLRPLIAHGKLQKVYVTLRAEAKNSVHKMWSRRAREYEEKINSGDILLVAEVVRDLYKGAESNRSYSERNIYNVALKRLAKELSALENIKIDKVIDSLVSLLQAKVVS